VRQGECTACHSPHGGKLDHFLLGQPGDLCITCHKDIKEKLDSTFKHSPAAGGMCLQCHNGHVSSRLALVKADQFDLCSTCHDLKTGGFAKAHLDKPAKGMNCSGCHELHGSNTEGLFQPIVHPPFGGRSCELCHKKGQGS
jgi:predicted CXXCH cytochrome family protein